MAIHSWKSLRLLCKHIAGLVISDNDAAGDVSTSLANTNWHCIPHGTGDYPKNLIERGSGKLIGEPTTIHELAKVYKKKH